MTLSKNAQKLSAKGRANIVEGQRDRRARERAAKPARPMRMPTLKDTRDLGANFIRILSRITPGNPCPWCGGKESHVFPLDGGCSALRFLKSCGKKRP